MTKPLCCVALATVAFVIACASTDTSGPAELPSRPTGAVSDTASVAYKAPPPAGYLPWPQHSPDFTPAQYDDMMQRLYLFDNFGLYQGGAGNPALMYAHSGLDVSLPNNTKVYAVAPGVVRYVDRRTEFYRQALISDIGSPSTGWGYTHIDSFQVNEGDTVRRGTYLGKVRFQGLEHVHLSRLRLLPVGTWKDNGALAHSQPDKFFFYRDSEPPVFDAPFRFFRDDSDVQFSAGSPTVVSGNVDIVVGMRDPGAIARAQPDFGVSDRLAVSRIEYEITGPAGFHLKRASWDFGKLEFTGGGLGQPTGAQQAGVVYKYFESVFPGTKSQWWQRKFVYYILTNSPDPVREGLVNLNDASNSWQTGQLPNGDYSVTVRAFDFRGNTSSRTEVVRVKN
jgi:murein DD-endopeptidase MepM/ murein hydrolase activator NlpD